jgi:hypothetical protein
VEAAAHQGQRASKAANAGSGNDNGPRTPHSQLAGLSGDHGLDEVGPNVSRLQAGNAAYAGAGSRHAHSGGRDS